MFFRLVVTFLIICFPCLCSNSLFAEEAKQPEEPKKEEAAPSTLPAPAEAPAPAAKRPIEIPGAPMNPPPILVLQGEHPRHRIVVKEIKVGDPVIEQFTIGVRGESETFTHKVYGLPEGAKFEVKPLEGQNRFTFGTFSWIPNKTGSYPVAFEITSSNKEVERLAIFYTVSEKPAEKAAEKPAEKPQE